MGQDGRTRQADGAWKLAGAKAAIAICFTALVGVTAVGAQRAQLVRFDDLGPHELRVAAFRLEAAGEVRVDAVGADATTRHNKWLGKMARVFDIPLGDDQEAWPGNAWILDAATREVVWELRSAANRDLGDGVRAFDGTVPLPAGTYEVYYASYSGERRWVDGDQESGSRSDGSLDEAYYEYDDGGLSREFRLELSGDGQALGAKDLAAARARFRADALLSYSASEPDALFRRGFVLDRPATVDVYAVGEAQESEAYDVARLIDAGTQRTVWALGGRSAHAGGATKNRMARQRIDLPAGRYALVYATDDSHDPSDWNAAPPHDPAFWGVVLKAPELTAAPPATYDYDPTPAELTVLALHRAGNGASLVRGFTLPEALTMRIVALGEASGSDLVDHGWIEDAESGQTVWRMHAAETSPAGGADKNRLYMGDLRLHAGDYLAHYVTDGSHAFGDWNAAAPTDPEDWGLTILAPEGFDLAKVRTFEERDRPGLLARLTRMRDDEDARATLTLEADGVVRVYALGEGTGGTMHDFAWIEDTAGRTVWQMTYRMTEHAGGASKNRVFDGTVHLPAGRYVVRYRSDGSHAFGAWNASPPEDAASWGVTVLQPRN